MADDKSKSTPNVTVKAGDKIELIIENADNMLIVIMNTTKVDEVATNNDPPLNRRIDLTESLKPGTNYLNIVGIDTGVRHHFKFHLDLNGNGVPGVSVDEQGPPIPYSRHYPYTITLQ